MIIELWLIYALIAALFTGLAHVTNKKILLKEHAMEFSAAFSLVMLIISIPFFFFIEYTISFNNLLLMLLASFLGSIGFLLTMKAVRHLEVSESAPLFVFGPAVVVLLAFIFLGESLSPLQLSGIGLLLIGSYILELKKDSSWFGPFKIFKKSKYVHYIFIALILYSISGIIERYLLHYQSVNPYTFFAFVHLFLFIFFFIMLYFFRDGFKGIKHGFIMGGRWILLAALFTVVYRLSQIYAIMIAPVGLVSSIKRLSVLFVVLVGGHIFHDKNIKRRMLASIIMVAGTILIAIY